MSMTKIKRNNKSQNRIRIKNILFLIIVITALYPAFNPTIAQDIDDTEALSFVDFDVLEKQSKKFDSKTKLYKSEAERVAKAKTYDLYVSKKFGSYLNPYNGTLNIINSQNKNFTKAQFLNKTSKKNEFSISIDIETKTVDISKFKAGDYLLILSNNNGDILVEDFIII